MDKPVMSPAPGERLLRFVGDRVRFSVRMPHSGVGARAMLRTTLGKAERLRQEVIATHAGKSPLSVAFWRDIPLERQPNGEWAIEMPLTDVGFHKAKAYALDAEGRQIWPEGGDVGISVHPDSYRTGNTVYCAFARMFGPNKALRNTQNECWEKTLNKLDQQGYTVIPPSGTLRDLIRELPHIFENLGSRVLHLLPVNPTPTTFARFGRFGSPYACLDLVSVDHALVEFDKATTGIDQFCELTHGVHRRGGRVFLDIVINHTGWGSRLQEDHPDWFLRHPDGTFASPGAWGTTWGDLVELDPAHVELWEEFANAFLTWCRRGVDGFRCDAGYKVPLQVWQYVEARVRQEFPDTVFLLEGLGGALEATELLLTEGGMQWAYSELFQNYTGEEVARYLDYSIRQSERVGVYVHYSETHDNNRLAWNGRSWSLMRNRLSALTSVSGGYGFTCGVEWLAPEKVNVHSARGLAWGNEDNLVRELATLNHLVTNHPCFFDGAKLTRLSEINSPVYALRRDSADKLDRVLVLVNTDVNNSHEVRISQGSFVEMGGPRFDLLGQFAPKLDLQPGHVTFTLAPGAAYCLASAEKPLGLSGEAYRRARAQSAWAFSALSRVLLPEDIGPCSWCELADRIDADPRAFLATLAYIDPNRSRKALLSALDAVSGKYPHVVSWTLLDRRRITPVPPKHWLLLQDERPFRASLHFQSGPDEHVESIEVSGGHVAFFAPHPCDASMDAELTVERYALTSERVRARVRFLSSEPSVNASFQKPPPNAMVLLTNGRGGMARMCVDLGRVQSKYDCVLGANLHADFPVDRHVFVKRIRAWVNADGFITQLNLQNLESLEIGPPAVWHWIAEAGDGRTVSIQLSADMLEGWNTTVLRFSRVAQGTATDLPPQFDVHLVIRVDIEDRNFHQETHRTGGADHHFSICRALEQQTGFIFAPATDRHLRVIADSGVYHSQPEWSQGLQHPVEQGRGQVGQGDAYSPGWFELPLTGGRTVTLALSADALSPTFDLIEDVTSARSIEDKVALNKAGFSETDMFGQQLALAASAFVTRRGSGRTIIAGYPWFLDWGRDSFISARGLLGAGMIGDVAELLITFGRFEENGTMPNTIFGEDASNRNTSDAPLWYGVVCEELSELMSSNFYQIPVDHRGRKIADILRDIAVGYIRGTSNGIRMDSESALIWSPSHFTWMDTNYPACTPREGYPVEIQVLWIKLLRQLARVGVERAGEDWEALADRALKSLETLFWLEEKGYVADLLIAGAGQSAKDAVVDNALRSNYLLAIAWGHFAGHRARRAVDAASRYLVIPGALRSLAPLPVKPPLMIYGADGRLLSSPIEPYRGRYAGDEDTQRKPAYHNGTAWTWTFPIFCEALARAWDCSPSAVAAAKAYLASMDASLMEGCLGHIPEILDGDAPHQQRGCDAQAWGVTEALRVWKWLCSLKP